MTPSQINNVGTNVAKATEEYNEEDFSFLMATNFESAYHLSQLAHPLLKSSKAGSIVFMSSVGGVVSVTGGSIYGATKGINIIYCNTSMSIYIERERGSFPHSTVRLVLTKK